MKFLWNFWVGVEQWMWLELWLLLMNFYVEFLSVFWTILWWLLFDFFRMEKFSPMKVKNEVYLLKKHICSANSTYLYSQSCLEGWSNHGILFEWNMMMIFTFSVSRRRTPHGHRLCRQWWCWCSGVRWCRCWWPWCLGRWRGEFWMNICGSRAFGRYVKKVLISLKLWCNNISNDFFLCF